MQFTKSSNSKKIIFVCMSRNYKFHNPEVIPFGLKFINQNSIPPFVNNSNKYLYNGKELQDEGFDTEGNSENDRWLDWYDYGARFYDPALERFYCIDPRVEDYFSWSPYNYVGNNPIRRVDIKGEGWGDVMYYMDNNKEAIKGKSQSEYFKPGGGGMDAYNNSPAGNYSYKVQEKYKRRKTGESNEKYPFQKK